MPRGGGNAGGLNEKQKQLLKELQESFGGPTGENNSPRFEKLL
ncbi:Chaperone protein DnaJ [Klebsiella pneumoniae]|uniref:Chaperone protein DnaJ n=1 Tax=Klebsiella pneumoniae TaxID=573 RepID=A0A3S4GJA7_KLEPN|nr:Chaperone protein DnaJ [Klebsiella pneumoniae]